MSLYFDQQNPPPSRDVQADLDRIPEHFARLAEMRDREDFSAYCKRVNLRIAPIANGWHYAFDAWKQMGRPS